MILDYFTSYNKELVLALGFFDSVHKGHRLLINRCKEIADELKVESAVFTFSDNLYKSIGLDYNQIYTFEERCYIINSLNINNVLAANPNQIFIEQTADEFLCRLSSNFKIKSIICGNDFRFGKQAKGDINLLKAFCRDMNLDLVIYDLLYYNNNKVSSSNIRTLIESGRIEEANSLLGEPYFVMGNVIRGKGNGKFLGFPTENIITTNDKLKLNYGVYVTSIKVDNIVYNSLTSVGGRPTFNDDEFTIETFIIDYHNEELYNKNVTIYFHHRIRDLIAFDSKEELSEQIKKDFCYAESYREKKL